MRSASLISDGKYPKAAPLFGTLYAGVKLDVALLAGRIEHVAGGVHRVEVLVLGRSPGIPCGVDQLVCKRLPGRIGGAFVVFWSGSADLDGLAGAASM